MAVKQVTARRATPLVVKTQRQTTGATVTIACKLPAGMALEIREGEGEQMEFHRFAVLVGTTDPRNTQDGMNRAAVGGYGLTPGVSQDLWERWLDQNKFLPAVKNGLIFAYDKLELVKGQAREMADVKSGFERLDPINPMGDGTIEMTDDQKEELKKHQADEAGFEELDDED